MSDDEIEDALFEYRWKRTLAEADRNLRLWLAVFEEEGGISFEDRPYDVEREEH